MRARDRLALSLWSPLGAACKKKGRLYPPAAPSGGLAFVIGGRNEKARRLIDISLLALTRAWVATVVAVAVLLASFAIEQDWNSAVYWRGLPQAFELIGDAGPPID